MTNDPTPPNLRREIRIILETNSIVTIDWNRMEEELLALIDRERKAAVEEAFKRLAQEDGWMQDEVVQIPYGKIMRAMFPSPISPPVGDSRPI